MQTLRVWAKNQIRFEFSEKIFEFTYENLNGKFILTNFSPNFLDICHSIQLWKITPFSYNFSVSGGGISPQLKRFEYTKEYYKF